MPSYDMKCDECKQIKEIFCKIAEMDDQKCDCGGPLNAVLNTGYALHKFKAGYYEHIASEPIYCGSKRQLKTECDKRGLTSIYASEW